MLALIIRIVLFSAVVFSLLRLSLFAAYTTYFESVSLLAALWSGLRFDLQLTVMAYAPFLLLLLLPIPQWQTKTFRQLCTWACAAILAVLFSIAVADAAYFGEAYRHLGGELFNIGNDIGAMVETALTSRWVVTLGGIASLMVMAWAWWRLVAATTQTISNNWRKMVVYCFIGMLSLVFLGRGMVIKGKPLDAIDAFNGYGQAQANLALNGALLSLQAFKNRHHQKPLVYLNDVETQSFDAHYPHPFLYHPRAHKSDKNIVFILMESWSYRYIDALANNGYHVTPNMDALIGKSQVWDNFFAAGQRSIIGIQAALTSVPALPEREPIGFGLELSNISRIAELASQQGYRTIMAQSSKRRSFHMDGIANALGFQEYYGQEDVPLIRDYPQGIPAFGWDYDTLMFFGKKLSQNPNKPFFAFFFTGTTHEPFADAGTDFHIYPHDTKGENGFLNTLKYSDWSIGEFMKYAAQQPWYHNTVFVFVADHTLNSGVRGGTVRERFHIPLIMFDPNQPNPVHHSRQASQYDLMPTFADVLGIDQPIYTFGQSLFTDPQPLPLMLNQGNSTAMLDGNISAEFQNQQLIAGQPSSQLKLLQWRMQEADRLLRTNTWSK